MITSSIVLYKTNKKDLHTIINCVLNSSISTLYLIDNSPTNELGVYANKYKSDRIIYIFNKKNIGYGSGHNIAIKKSIEESTKYHIVINPDVYFESNIIEELVMFMDKRVDCGLVMPKVLYPNGKIQCLCKLLPSPIDLFERRFIPFTRYKEKKAMKFELHFTGYNQIMEVPSLSGCFMFIRVSVLKKVCGFDERFFMYAEDLDLCRRIGEVSKTIYYPRVSIYHEYGKGSYKNRKLLKYHISSVVKYFNKWGWFFDKKRKLINKQVLTELNYKQK